MWGILRPSSREVELDRRAVLGTVETVDSLLDAFLFRVPRPEVDDKVRAVLGFVEEFEDLDEAEAEREALDDDSADDDDDEERERVDKIEDDGAEEKRS